MNTGAGLAGAVFAVFAVGDWIAVALAKRRLEYLCKPAALGALLVTALVLDPADGAMRAWFAVALGWSLAGDVFLMLPEPATERSGRGFFVPGLASFLLGHLAYIVGLNLDGGAGVGALAAGGLAVAAVAVPLGVRVVRGARAHDRRLAVPVSAYVAVISVMVISALARGWTWAAPGALLFYASDACIGWSRFIHPFRGHRVVIIVTYHLGQAALVASLLS